jgi:hypothetical protein
MYLLFQEMLASGLDNADDDTVKADVWAVVHQWGFEKFNSHWHAHNTKALEAKRKPVLSWQDMRYAAELLTALKELQAQKSQGLCEQKLQEIARIQAQVQAIEEAAQHQGSEFDDLIDTLKPQVAKRRAHAPPVAPSAKRMKVKKPKPAAAAAIAAPHAPPAKRRMSEVDRLRLTCLR